jgi:hypothetical protein
MPENSDFCEICGGSGMFRQRKCLCTMGTGEPRGPEVFKIPVRVKPLPTPEYSRPRFRSECVNGVRPCPFVGCRYNLYLSSVGPQSIKVTFPHLQPWELQHSCALDAVGEATLQEVADRMNVTRERARQIELAAMKKLNCVVKK